MSWIEDDLQKLLVNAARTVYIRKHKGNQNVEWLILNSLNISIIFGSTGILVLKVV